LRSPSGIDWRDKEEMAHRAEKLESSCENPPHRLLGAQGGVWWCLDAYQAYYYYHTKLLLYVWYQGWFNSARGLTLLAAAAGKMPGKG
jgi:hypothetical protein